MISCLLFGPLLDENPFLRGLPALRQALCALCGTRAFGVLDDGAWNALFVLHGAHYTT